MSGFHASEEQREKVRDLPCIYCGEDYKVDPAHLCARSQGGCDDPDCVIPLCRECHIAFDAGDLDIEPLIAMDMFAPERGHMATHMSLRRCIHRLSGRRCW